MVTPCENLATKAELKELKDKFNKLLGLKEDGEEINVLEEETLEGTIIGNAIKHAFNAIQDFGIGTEASGIVENVDSAAINGLATGSLSYVAVKGTNVVKLLPKASKVVQLRSLRLVQTGQVASTAAKGAQVTAATLALVSSLANIIGTLGLNIMTVNTLGFRIDQNEKAIGSWNADYERLGKLLASVKNDYNELQIEFAKADKIITDLKLENDDLKSKFKEQNTTIETLNSELGKANTNIELLQGENQKLLDHIDNLEFEYDQEIANLKEQAEIAKQNLEIAQKNSDTLLEVAKNLGKNLADLEGRVDVMYDQFKKLSAIQTLHKAEANQLKQELEAEFVVVKSKLTTHGAKLLALEKRVNNTSTGAGGLSVPAQKSITDSQMATLELANTLAGNPLSSSSLQIQPYQATLNNPFADLFNQLLPQINIQPGGLTDVNLADLQQTILDGIDNKFTDYGLVDFNSKLTNIQTQTAPDTVVKNLEDALCKSSSSGKCLSNKIKKPLEDKITNLNDLVNNNAGALSGLNALLNRQILGKINNVQNFLNTAWQSTTVQKGMTALNTALLIHNASMLSRDLVGTVGDTTSLVLNGFGIKDFEGNDIDVNQTVGSLVQKSAELVLGSENLTALQKSFLSANRIIQAANGTISAIQNMKDSSLEGMEIIGRWQANMGNAFIEQGLLEIESYEWMDVDLDLKTPLGGFIGKFQVAQEIVDEISNLASTGIGVIESANELIKQQEEFKSASDDLKENLSTVHLKKQEAEVIEIANSASPQIEPKDLIQIDN